MVSPSAVEASQTSNNTTVQYTRTSSGAGAAIPKPPSLARKAVPLPPAPAAYAPMMAAAPAPVPNAGTPRTMPPLPPRIRRQTSSGAATQASPPERTPYMFDFYDLPPQQHRQISMDIEPHSGKQLPSPMQTRSLSRSSSTGASPTTGSRPLTRSSLAVTAAAAGGISMPDALERATTEQVQAAFPSPVMVQQLSHNHSHADHAPAAGAASDMLMNDHQPPQMLRGASTASFSSASADCEQCWADQLRCKACQQIKQQTLANGWPVDAALKGHAHEHAGIKAEDEPSVLYNALPPNLYSDIPMPPVKREDSTLLRDEDESKLSDPLPSTLPAMQEAHPKSGKLSKYLLGDFGGLELLATPHYPTPSSSAYAAPPSLSLGAPLVTGGAGMNASASAASSSGRKGGRSLRARKVRSRSPSPEFSDMSNSDDSGSDTDEHEEAYDDTISPQSNTGGDMDYSESSSAEPPQPTNLLPVSASALLPSRPSTAAVPPAHIKDRLVNSARKLLTAADGVNDAVQVQVIPIWYPRKHAGDGGPGAQPHKIRLIRVFNTDTQTVSMYAHAADVGGVVERKSNISRLFGKFESPSEKLLMNVVGAHNHTVGQESNILTSKGVRKFLTTNKMKDEHQYRKWITDVLLPKLLHDPLEIGEELVEIEASTDPNAPTTIKPARMKRMERKRALKKAEMKLHKQAQAAAANPESHAAKRAKHEHAQQAQVHTNTPPLEPVHVPSHAA